MAKVSVISIAYNAEDFIERTIKSVAEQTYADIEYLIIDGASKDKTLEIANRYAQHIDFLQSEPDKSYADAMNKGIQNATGDYIVFLNCGDVFANKDSLKNCMQGSNGADLVYGNAIYVDEQGNTRAWHKETPLPEQLDARSFMYGMVICHQCMIVKRTVAPLFDLQYKIANDVDWSIRTMKKVKTKHYFPETLILFLDGGLSDQQRRKAVKERFRISRKHFGLFTTAWATFKMLIKAYRRGGVK